MVSETPGQTSRSAKSLQHMRYITACFLVYLVVCGVAIRGFTTPWVMWGFILLLSLPIAWLAASFSAAKREHGLSILRVETRLRRLLTGSTVRVMLSTLVGLVFALLLFSKLTVFTALDAALLGLAIPLLAILNHHFSRYAKDVFVARQRSRVTIWFASLMTALVLGSLNVTAVLFEPTLASPLISKDLWVDSFLWHTSKNELSAGYVLISKYAGAWQAAESWAAASARDRIPMFGFILSLIFELGSYGGFVAIYAFFLLPWSELKRAILPAKISSGSRPLRAGEIAWASATVVFLIVFVYRFAVVDFERYASSKAAHELQDNITSRLPNDPRSPSLGPDIAARPTSESDRVEISNHEGEPSPELIVDRPVETIGERFYEPGTTQSLIEAGSEIERINAEARAEAKVMVLRSFDRVRSKGVPKFLDWYYSLTGEYARTLATLGGSGEELLAQKLEDSLVQTDRLSDQLKQVAKRYEAEIKATQANYTQILQENLVTLAPTERPVEVGNSEQKRISLSNLDTGFVTGLRQRLIGSSAAGTAVGGLIAVTVARKVATKGVLKVAAKAVTKAVASRGVGGGGGAAGGALAGGALGSFVPFVGTAIGAAIGGIAGGLAGGVAIDYAVLGIEEYYGREAFEAEILEAINDVEAQTIVKLGL